MCAASLTPPVVHAHPNRESKADRRDACLIMLRIAMGGCALSMHGDRPAGSWVASESDLKECAISKGKQRDGHPGHAPLRLRPALPGSPAHEHEPSRQQPHSAHPYRRCVRRQHLQHANACLKIMQLRPLRLSLLCSTDAIRTRTGSLSCCYTNLLRQAGESALRPERTAAQGGPRSRRNRLLARNGI